MRFSMQMPRDAAVALSGGDAAFISGDGARLLNGAPADTCRLSWPTGAQTTATSVYLDVSYGSARSLNLVGALQNCGLPAGTLVEVTMRRPADLTGFPYPATPYSTRLFERETGDRNAYLALDNGLDPVTAVRVRIRNDVNGVASIAAGTLFDLGGLFVGSGYDEVIEAGWSEETDDATLNEDTDFFQLNSTYGPSRRILTIKPFIKKQQDAFGGGGARAPIDFRTLVAQTGGGQPLVVVERVYDDTGAISADLVNRTATYCYRAKNASMKHLAGSLFDPQELVFNEIACPK